MGAFGDNWGFDSGRWHRLTSDGSSRSRRRTARFFALGGVAEVAVNDDSCCVLSCST